MVKKLDWTGPETLKNSIIIYLLRQEMDLQDDSITIISHLDCQSLQVVMLIHEYTELSWPDDSLLYPVKLQV